MRVLPVAGVVVFVEVDPLGVTTPAPPELQTPALEPLQIRSDDWLSGRHKRACERRRKERTKNVNPNH